MKILAIETSCDETAIALLDGRGSKNTPVFKVLSNVILSQIDIHREYGGVFPNLAKREHVKNIIPVLVEALERAKLYAPSGRGNTLKPSVHKKILKILEREGELGMQLISLLEKMKRPKIDALAVTYGPGLEPALWVGINFAKALALAWELPLIPVNHMEGHIYSSFIKEPSFSIPKLSFPVLSLLVSGGHTEIVHIKKHGLYKKIGETRDDASGEAFDKIARTLGLPYPGGPEISRLAEKAKKKADITLPRPMMNSKDYDFSFSGLKTSVLYMVQKLGTLTEDIRGAIAKEAQEAIVDVLVSKTLRALKETKSSALLLGGGVAANDHLRTRLEQEVSFLPKVSLFLPDKKATTDNALMIAVAGFMKKNNTKTPINRIVAKGNLSL